MLSCHVFLATNFLRRELHVGVFNYLHLVAGAEMKHGQSTFLAGLSAVRDVAIFFGRNELRVNNGDGANREGSRKLTPIDVFALLQLKSNANNSGIHASLLSKALGARGQITPSSSLRVASTHCVLASTHGALISAV